MKTITALFLLFVATSLSTFAGEIEFFSRNMPQTCTYVYAVESDLKLKLPLDVQDREIIFQLQNSWDPFNWTTAESIPLIQFQDGFYANWTFQSMSIPGHFLYRNVQIELPNQRIVCHSEFGREFGEMCMPSGREATPWRKRKIECKSF